MSSGLFQKLPQFLCWTCWPAISVNSIPKIFCGRVQEDRCEKCGKTARGMKLDYKANLTVHYLDPDHEKFGAAWALCNLSKHFLTSDIDRVTCKRCLQIRESRARKTRIPLRLHFQMPGEVYVKGFTTCKTIAPERITDNPKKVRCRTCRRNLPGWAKLAAGIT